jgi:pimeloyl-ACP methyl ester carboxylesterase
MKVYFISGLAADSRVFQHIKLPQGYEPVYIEWIKALKNESLSDYSKRLAASIDSSKPFGLIGLSMGGMVATEISKQHALAFTILLSSVPSYKNFPVRFKISYWLRLHKILPVQLFKSASIIKRFFTAETKADKLILEQVIKDSDPVFIRWALGAILEWKNETIPGSYFHIHGSKDEILPMKNTTPTHIIPGGTHLMVLSKAGEVNKILAGILNKGMA